MTQEQAPEVTSAALAVQQRALDRSFRSTYVGAWVLFKHAEKRHYVVDANRKYMLGLCRQWWPSSDIRGMRRVGDAPPNDFIPVHFNSCERCLKAYERSAH